MTGALAASEYESECIRVDESPNCTSAATDVGIGHRLTRMTHAFMLHTRMTCSILLGLVSSAWVRRDLLRGCTITCPAAACSSETVRECQRSSALDGRGAQPERAMGARDDPMLHSRRTTIACAKIEAAPWEYDKRPQSWSCHTTKMLQRMGAMAHVPFPQLNGVKPHATWLREREQRRRVIWRRSGRAWSCRSGC